jgi:fused signal recognition particle receptor
MQPEPTVLLLLVLVALLVAAVWIWLARRAGSPAIPSKGLSGRLPRSRRAFSDLMHSVFSGDQVDADDFNQLEEALIAADVGVGPAARLVARVKKSGPADRAGAYLSLRRELVSLFVDGDRSLHRDRKPAVILVVGVNGSGKTTSIAKLAHRFEAEGITSLLGAADTFRAAAGAQLRIWAERVGVPVVGGQEGADPAAVAFDAYQAARARGKDVVIIDTAGRLHSKEHLMAELVKIRRVVEREAGGIDEVLLVLDATAGQNGIVQVKEFSKAVGVTGIILTKLDGTSRGGIVVAVEEELSVPVKFAGVGEGLDDLVPFAPLEFIDELLAAP